MKRLTQLSLIILISFLSSSFVVKPERPKNIILLIGDGMGLSQISYAVIESTQRLNFERFRCIGFSKTSSTSSRITDSAAGATAPATGKKTYNGAIAVDDNKKPLKTILEIAEENGLSTGLVATCAITHATPAAFIAHQSSRSKYEEIAADFLKTDIDVFIGGGLEHFTKRKDGRNLTKELLARGYKVVTNQQELFAEKSYDKLAALVADKHLPKMQEGRGDYEKRSARLALNILSKNDKGYFLMVEGSQIDWGGHANDPDYIKQETLDFDAVIGEVLDYAGKDGNTLVIVTADHETGGFALTGESSSSNSEEYGSIVPAFTTGGHSAAMVPVFAYGPGAEEFMGIYENTEIFYKMKNLLGF